MSIEGDEEMRKWGYEVYIAASAHRFFGINSSLHLLKLSIDDHFTCRPTAALTH